MKLEEIKKMIAKSVKRLRRRDSHLFDVDINERSLAHKFAEILQVKFGKQWNVDCEYNRNGLAQKLLNLIVINIGSDDLTSCTVYPDIIIHKRGTSENLLVIEIKKSSNGQSRLRDYEKLIAYRRQLGYIHAVFIEFNTESNGKKCDLIQYNEECE